MNHINFYVKLLRYFNLFQSYCTTDVHTNYSKKF